MESQITCEWQCTPPVTALQVAMFPAVASSSAVIVVCTAGSSGAHAEANNTAANTAVRGEKQREDENIMTNTMRVPARLSEITMTNKSVIQTSQIRFANSTSENH